MLGLLSDTAQAPLACARTNVSALTAIAACAASGSGAGFWWVGGVDSRLFYTPSGCTSCDVQLPVGWPATAAPTFCQVKGGQLYVAVANASGAGTWAIYASSAALPTGSDSSLSWGALAWGAGGGTVRGFSFAPGSLVLYVAVEGRGVVQLARAGAGAAFASPLLNPGTAGAVDVLVNANGRKVFVLLGGSLAVVDASLGTSWDAAAVAVLHTLPADGSQFTGLALAPT